MSTKDKGWAAVVAVWLVGCMIGLGAVLFLRWPQGAAARGTAEPIEPNVPAEPNEPPVKGEITTVLRVDTKPMAIGRVYHITDRTGPMFVFTPAQLPVSGRNLAILALAMGALGACLHGVTSLVYHLSAKDFGAEWTAWYLHRPLVGGALALIFYLIIAGGLMPQVDMSTGGVCATIGLAGLIGLFSRQALDKLGEIFDVIFSPRQSDEARGAPAAPQIDTFDPPTIPPDGDETTLTIQGSGFIQGAVVKISDKELTATCKSDRELTVVISKEQLAQPGPLALIVANPDPPGGTSEPKALPRQ